MEVEIKNVINELKKKSDGSMAFAVAIACLEEADKQSEVIEIIKEYFVLTSEYGKLSLEQKKIIPENKLNELKEELL